MEKSPSSEGLRWRTCISESPVAPKGVRGVVLLCGFIAAAAFGVGAVIGAGDPIGWVYVVAAATGALFLPTRLVPTVLWLLVAGAGIAVGAAGNASGWIEVALGLALACVAVLPERPVAPGEGGTRPAQANDPLRPILNSVGDAPAPLGSVVIEREESQSGPADVAPGLQVAAMPAARIRAFGNLDLMVGDRALTTRMEPRLRFLFGYLLARQLTGVVSTQRSLLAEEIAPGIQAGSQKDRLRKQLHELQSLEPALSGILHADREKVWLDLDGLDCDAVDVLRESHDLAADPDLIDGSRADRLTRLLEATRAEFLAGFEDLDNQVTRGQSAAMDTVQSARVALANAKARLADTVADYRLAAGHAGAAIPLLLDVLEAAPNPDTARLLVAAYVQSGQISRARDIRREYGLTEEK